MTAFTGQTPELRDDALRAGYGIGPQDGQENEVGQNTSCRVLVVDNYVSAAEALAEACSRYHDVRFVGGGSAAMEVALAWHPDVMILDIDMPSPNGLEVATMIRDISHMGPITLIAVTGRSAAFGQEEALAHGFDDYMIKPVDVEKLLALIAARRTGPVPGP